MYVHPMPFHVWQVWLSYWLVGTHVRLAAPLPPLKL
jgi:hypothetical protein